MLASSAFSAWLASSSQLHLASKLLPSFLQAQSVVAAFMLLTKFPYEAWSFLSVWSRSFTNVLEFNLAAFNRRHILRFPSSCISSCALLAAKASLQRTTINLNSILRKCLDYFNRSGLCITQFEYTSILRNRLAVPNPGPASSGGESNPKLFNS